jgi:hypothetical protein
MKTLRSGGATEFVITKSPSFRSFNAGEGFFFFTTMKIVQVNVSLHVNY